MIFTLPKNGILTVQSKLSPWNVAVSTASRFCRSLISACTSSVSEETFCTLVIVYAGTGTSGISNEN